MTFFPGDLIEKDLEVYAKEAGLEPQIDPWWMSRVLKRECHIVNQHAAWQKWWLEWYRQPLRRT